MPEFFSFVCRPGQRAIKNGVTGLVKRVSTISTLLVTDARNGSSSIWSIDGVSFGEFPHPSDRGSSLELRVGDIVEHEGKLVTITKLADDWGMFRVVRATVNQKTKLLPRSSFKFVCRPGQMIIRDGLQAEVQEGYSDTFVRVINSSGYHCWSVQGATFEDIPYKDIVPTPTFEVGDIVEHMGELATIIDRKGSDRITYSIRMSDEKYWQSDEKYWQSVSPNNFKFICRPGQTVTTYGTKGVVEAIFSGKRLRVREDKGTLAAWYLDDCKFGEIPKY